MVIKYIDKFISKSLLDRLAIVAINIFINTLVIFYLLDIYGLEKFGLISRGLIIINLSILILEWGFQTHATELLAKNNFDNSFHSYFMCSCIWKLILFALIIIFMLLPFNNLLLNLSFYQKLSILFAIILGGFNPLWILNILKKTQILLLPTILGKAFHLLAIFLFIKKDTNFLNVYLFHSIPFICSLFFGYTYLINKKFIKYIKFSTLDLKILKNSFEYFLANLINNNFTSLWSVYVIYFCSNTTIAIFAIIEQIFRGMLMISNLVSNTLRIETIKLKTRELKIKIFRILFMYIGLTSLTVILYFIVKNYIHTLQLYDLSFLAFICIWFVFSCSRLFATTILSQIINMNRVNNLFLLFGLGNILLIFINYSLNVVNLTYLSLSILILCIIELLFFLNKFYGIQKSKL